MLSAYSITVRGVVQGVGFRPFVYRLARANTLTGWVLNGEGGVEIFLEGSGSSLDAFVEALSAETPHAAAITEIKIEPSQPVGLSDFTIRQSQHRDRPSVRISADLAVCDLCLAELFDPFDNRFSYPYINCTNCGPRYSIIRSLPYDRANTTMGEWMLDPFCERQYSDAGNRRFHAQPVACPSCGPNYYLQSSEEMVHGNEGSIRRAAHLLQAGKIVAVKGLGGYHLACDARNPQAVEAVRERKYRKEKPFALMAKDLRTASGLVSLSAESEALLTSAARPIVIAPANLNLPGIAPETAEFGVMLPYTPLQHLLFAAGAPEILVMTSANRSSEPIAYRDDEARDRLSGIADAFLVGERPIARRVEDSIVRAGAFGPAVLRRSRGYAPGAVSQLPTRQPILAVGADLKNTITLVVDGQAFMSQYIGDLDQYECLQAFHDTIRDLTTMYEISLDDLLVVHDCHPQYVSTAAAGELVHTQKKSVQHHRAHLGSVLAERSAWEKRVLGISLDGTGYGDDATIWGGEIFIGSISDGFKRAAHLRPALLVGGDAAAQHPTQAAAGFLSQVAGLPDLVGTPFHFPKGFAVGSELVRKGVRAIPTTSVGRLFDTAAALLGFTRRMSFEGQAAMWLEQMARRSSLVESYSFPFVDHELDFRPLLASVAWDRYAGRNPQQIARAFHRGVAQGLYAAASALCRRENIDTVVLSGGVFQNELLLEDLKTLFDGAEIAVWTNHLVPANDGGISLGQAALAAFRQFDSIS